MSNRVIKKGSAAKKVDAAAPAGAAEASPAPAVMAPVADEPLAAKIDRAVAEVIAPHHDAPIEAAAAPLASAELAQPAAVAAPAADQPAEVMTSDTPHIDQTKDETMETTTPQTNDFAQKIKDTAADAQSRAKAAYDKMQAYTGDITEFTKGNVEALVESGKILGAGVQDIARSEVEAAKGAFETLTADLKALAGIKTPTELFKLQGEIARRNFDAAVARASKTAEVSVKLANDAFAPISSRMSVAAERFSNAA